MIRLVRWVGGRTGFSRESVNACSTGWVGACGVHSEVDQVRARAPARSGALGGARDNPA